MTGSAAHVPGTVPFIGLEVATVSGDELRASVRVAGRLEQSTVALLSSVLRTHMTAGRRYLRVDLAHAEVADSAVAAALLEAHTAVEAMGGMLVFENAGPRVMAAVSTDTLFVRAAEV